MPKILHLTLQKKWFDMIASGEKKEEYREMKNFWEVRLYGNGCKGSPIAFDTVRFKNGYAKKAPIIELEWHGTKVDTGLKVWGAEPYILYFVIVLGKIISIHNK